MWKMSQYQNNNISSNSDECQSIAGDNDPYYETTMETLYSYQNDSEHSDLNQILPTEEAPHWPQMCSSSPHEQEKSPYSPSSPYHSYVPIYFPPNGHIYDETYFNGQQETDYQNNLVRRPPKQRKSANKKERKRTQSINSAFALLRERIAMVPLDTKVSKIKTLRLAIRYIAFLQNQLNGHEDILSEFKPELITSSRKLNAEKKNYSKSCGKIINATEDTRRNKGRTGWPQHVWIGSLNTNKLT